MKKVLVTGANGFIGTFLLQELSKSGVEVIAILKDVNEPKEQIQVLPGVHISYCDQDQISNLPDIICDRDIETCIHLAWMGSFGELRANYLLQMTNVLNTLNTIKAIHDMGIKRFVGIGTLAEMDVLNYHFHDNAHPNPVSEYGIAKLTAHLMSKTECAKLGMEHLWCRLSNTYGVGNTTNNFVNMASRLMLSGKRAAFTSATQPYDFVYVTDTVRAIMQVAKNGKAFSNYYLGSGNPRPLKEYITIIRDQIDPTIKLFLGEIPFRGTPLPLEAYDTRKLYADTGFVPQIQFEVGISKTIQWLKETEFSSN